MVGIIADIKKIILVVGIDTLIRKAKDLKLKALIHRKS
jgi:hypothetical protein